MGYFRHLSFSYGRKKNASPRKEMRYYQGKGSETMDSNPMENDRTNNPIYKNQFLKPLVVHCSLSPGWCNMALQILHYYCTKNYLPYPKMNTWKQTKVSDGIKVFKLYFSLVYTVTANVPPPPILWRLFLLSVPPLFVSCIRLRIVKSRPGGCSSDLCWSLTGQWGTPGVTCSEMAALCFL